MADSSPKITVYTKTPCPYCVNAKALLDSLNVQYETIDISGDQNKLVKLHQKSGLMTVPQIFVGDKCLGGFDDINAMHKEDKLVPALKGE